MMRRLFSYPAEVIVLLFAIYVVMFKDVSSPWQRAIDSDGKGYYAYLTSTFIYNDHQYSFIDDYEAKYYPPDGSRYFEFRNDMPDGGKVNQYFPGVALLWIPFFLVAHFLSYLFGFETDGYSIIYQWSIMAAALFYLWMGLKITHKLLLRITSPRPAAFILLLLGFGTLLFHYTIYTPAFTHTYNFALIASLLYVACDLFREYSRKRVLLAVFLLCLIAIVRPSNAVVILLLPFAAGSWSAFRSFFVKLFHDPGTIAFSLAIAIALFSVPVWLWYKQTGHYFVYSYGPHRFNFHDPQFLNNLFSYRKGLFLYTPLAFVALLGLIPLFRMNRWRFTFLSLFLLAAAYIISSWSWWWYGWSLGQRSYVDYYVVLALLLAWLYNAIRSRKLPRFLFFLVTAFFILLNIVNTYQHIYGINPPDYITKEIYWDNFLRLKRKHVARAPISESMMQPTSLFFHDGSDKGWTSDTTKKDTHAHVARIDKNNHFSSIAFDRELKPFLVDSGMMLRVRATIMAPDEIERTVLVASFETDDKSYSYNAWNVGTYTEENEWIIVEFSLHCPPLQTEKDELKVYFWNADTEEELVIDDIMIEFFAPRK